MEVEKTIKDIKSCVAHEIATMREELDEHLTTINENTEELSSYGDELYNVSERMHKLEARMDELSLLFKQLVRQNRCSVELDAEEQRTFLIMYTTDSYISTKQLARKLGLIESVAHDLLMSMADKGIPFERELLDGKEFHRLDREFRVMQAREQIIKINPEITKQFQNTLLNKFFDE